MEQIYYKDVKGLKGAILSVGMAFELKKLISYGTNSDVLGVQFQKVTRPNVIENKREGIQIEMNDVTH